MYFEWTDNDGQRVVIRDGRISVYGSPSMTAEGSTTVAIGADIPAYVEIKHVEDLRPSGFVVMVTGGPGADLKPTIQVAGKDAIELPESYVARGDSLLVAIPDPLVRVT